jgi:hypothetical protein
MNHNKKCLRLVISSSVELNITAFEIEGIFIFASSKLFIDKWMNLINDKLALFLINYKPGVSQDSKMVGYPRMLLYTHSSPQSLRPRVVSGHLVSMK